MARGRRAAVTTGGKVVLTCETCYTTPARRYAHMPAHLNLQQILAQPSGARFYQCALPVNPFADVRRPNRQLPLATEAEYNRLIDGSVLDLRGSHAVVAPGCLPNGITPRLHDRWLPGGPKPTAQGCDAGLRLSRAQGQGQGHSPENHGRHESVQRNRAGRTIRERNLHHRFPTTAALDMANYFTVVRSAGSRASGLPAPFGGT